MIKYSAYETGDKRLFTQVLQGQQSRISSINNVMLREQQQKDLDALIQQRDAAAKAHAQQHGSGNYPADFKVGTQAIKSLVVSPCKLSFQNTINQQHLVGILSSSHVCRASTLSSLLQLENTPSQTASLNSKRKSLSWTCMGSLTPSSIPSY